MADNTERLRAADLIAAIKSAGIRFIVALPDRTTSEHLFRPTSEGILCHSRSSRQGSFSKQSTAATPCRPRWLAVR